MGSVTPRGESLEEEMRRILVMQTGRSAGDIEPESDLVADLDLDSVDFLALFAALRERYQVKPDIAWVIRRMRGATLRTFADLTEFISQVLDSAGESSRRNG